jgi:hypothetical protein
MSSILTVRKTQSRLTIPDCAGGGVQRGIYRKLSLKILHPLILQLIITAYAAR